jgi:hypothetical protein
MDLVCLAVIAAFFAPFFWILAGGAEEAGS